VCVVGTNGLCKVLNCCEATVGPPSQYLVLCYDLALATVFCGRSMLMIPVGLSCLEACSMHVQMSAMMGMQPTGYGRREVYAAAIAWVAAAALPTPAG
jgi:hypothetical protein